MRFVPLAHDVQPLHSRIQHGPPVYPAGKAPGSLYEVTLVDNMTGAHCCEFMFNGTRWRTLNSDRWDSIYAFDNNGSTPLIVTRNQAGFITSVEERNPKLIARIACPRPRGDHSPKYRKYYECVADLWPLRSICRRFVRDDQLMAYATVDHIYLQGDTQFTPPGAVVPVGGWAADLLRWATVIQNDLLQKYQLRGDFADYDQPQALYLDPADMAGAGSYSPYTSHLLDGVHRRSFDAACPVYGAASDVGFPPGNQALIDVKTGARIKVSADGRLPSAYGRLQVHRCIAMLYGCPNTTPLKMEEGGGETLSVDHLDGNHSNNSASNLQWTSHGLNCAMKGA